MASRVHRQAGQDRLEGTNGAYVDLGFDGSGQIGGQVRTDVKWDPNNTWNRVSFHIDPEEGTKVFLGEQFVGQAPSARGLTGIRFQGVLAAFVHDLVLVPKLVSPEELDKVHPWTDDHPLERPHVTPLQEEREIAKLAGKKGGKRSWWDRLLRSNL